MLSLIGLIIVIIGFILTLPFFSDLAKFIGWVLTSIGMSIVMVSSFINGSYVFAFFSFVILIGDLFFAVNYFMILKENKKKIAK